MDRSFFNMVSQIGWNPPNINVWDGEDGEKVQIFHASSDFILFPSNGKLH